MIYNIPLAIWFGMLTFICLFTTASLGVAVYFFHKNVFNYHKVFALLTVTFALVHLVLGVMLWFFGIVI
ncbi:MAG: hypothetical protein WCP89_03520 [archaeon]